MAILYSIRTASLRYHPSLQYDQKLIENFLVRASTKTADLCRSNKTARRQKKEKYILLLKRKKIEHKILLWDH